MTKTSWIPTSAATTYVPREKPIQESVAPFSGTISGAAPATTNLGTNSGQRILAADGTWIPQPAFTSGGADQLETLRPSVISPSYSANPPTVTDSAKAYDVDTNHATTFGQWYAAPESRTNNRVDIFSLTTWASKTQTWTAATINVSRSYAILQDGESSATSGSSSKTSSVKYEFSTNNGSSWTTLGTDTQSSIPTAPQTLSMALGTLTPTMGNILVKVTITRGGGGTIFEDGFSLPGLTGEVDLKLFDVWIDGTYAGGAGNITCNNLTVTGDATFQNKIYDSTASAGTTGQVLKVAANGKVTWATDSAGTGTVTSITTTGANGVTISGGSTQTITTSGTFALALGNITPTSISTGTGSFSGDVEFAASIKSPNGSNSPIVISPDGTGDLHVNADSLRLGDNNADATIATNGTGDLILTTHEGSATQGIIRLYDGANGNITLTPNGTGQVQVGSDQVVTLTASQTLTNKTLSTSSTWNGNTIGVAYGGTGSTTLTSGSYLVGNGTSAVTLKTPTQVTADLDTFTYQIGATAGKKGLVPAAPAIGASVVYLDQTGSWTTPSGSGTTTNALTISSPLTGTSFNGSTAVTIALASGYGDTQNPYGSKTANYFLASPNGSAGVPTFRAIVAADIPTLNQSTTGNAATASALQTARNINGVSFNGTADITVTAAANTLTGTTLASGVTASSLTSVGTLTGLTVTRTTSGDTGTFTNTSTTNQSANVNAVSDNSTAISLRVFGSAAGSYGMLAANSTALYTTATSLNLCADNASGVIKFSTGSSVPERMRLDASGNLGIGTASPYNKVEIEGASARLGLNNGGGASRKALLIEPLGYGGNAYARLESYDYGTSTGGVLALNVTGGNVGIGTTTPSQKLEVANGYSLFGGLRINGADASVNQIWQSNSGTNLGIMANGGAIVFGQTSTEQMRLTASGSLGIGTTNPVYKVQIEPTTVTAGGVNNLLRIGTQSTTAGTTSRFSMFCSTDPVNDTNGGKVFIDAIRTATNMDLAFSLNNTGGAAPVERMRLTGEGNLGLGTSSPSAKLTVNSGANRQIYIGQNTSNTNYNAISLNGSLSDSGLMGLAGGGTGDETLYVMSQGNMVFRTVGTNERMRIDSSGNVGIGRTPSYTLDLAGDARFKRNSGSGWVFQTPSSDMRIVGETSGAHLCFIPSSANVGIDTTSPSEKLNVIGKIKASDVLLGNNGTKGYGAITTTTSTSTPTGGASGDHYYIY